MGWRGSVAWAVALGGYASVFAPSGASAADAYVCGPDKIVYVEVSQLEAMKRTNACIAAHYGLTIDGAEAKREPGAMLAPEAQALRPLHDTELTERSPEPVRQPLAALAQREKPSAAAGTDYRTVKVLNAQDDADAWFHHTR